MWHFEWWWVTFYDWKGKKTKKNMFLDGVLLRINCFLLRNSSWLILHLRWISYRPVIPWECSCLGTCLGRTDPASPGNRRCRPCWRTGRCWASGSPWPMCRSHCGSGPAAYPGRGHSSWTRIWKCPSPGRTEGKTKKRRIKGVKMEKGRI